MEPQTEPTTAAAPAVVFADPVPKTRDDRAPTAVCLDRLEPGRCAVITRIDAPDADAERLMTMGVCPGRRVEMVKAGDPMILRVLGSRLGVSARLARRVWADPCGLPACPPSS